MVQVLNKDKFRQTGWKNGGGTTTELFVVEKKDEVVFRLSAATVSKNGPFSVYPGFKRITALVSGKGFYLKVNDQIVILNHPLRPFFFDGELEVDCELIEDECLDFNIMTDVLYGESQLIVHQLAEKKSCVFSSDHNSKFIFHYPAFKLYCLKPDESFAIEGNVNDLFFETTLFLKRV